jgi:hypothetical protein
MTCDLGRVKEYFEEHKDDLIWKNSIYFTSELTNDNEVNNMLETKYSTTCALLI